ncbi:MAG: hypothetical protein N2Z74_05130, partial [Syntrophales bacterium]|nr:hypothetical protein [Syntrophales bacterium]
AVPSAVKERRCDCQRCLWFGDTYQAGIVSVGDAEVENAQVETIHRIALCEHSFQNINLFASEYLTHGRFTMKIIIDAARGHDPAQTKPGECVRAIEAVLASMQPGHAPPGWIRLGATTGCTGQLTVHTIS